MGAIGQRRWRHYLAFGSGVGIEVGEDRLRVTVARVRPGGVRVEGTAQLERVRERSPLDWGAEYQALLQKTGVSHVAAVVLLPRRDVIVRVLAMPGVADRDLAAAIGFQADALHPFEEQEAVYGWARLPGTSDVLIGITRRQVVESYYEMFSQAGVKAASFTFSAAAFYGAIRMLAQDRPAAFVAHGDWGGDCEIYGESESRTVFSAPAPSPPQRAIAAAIAELRLAPETEPLPLAALLPAPRAAVEGFDLNESAPSYAAALASACPWLAVPANLLPEEWRASSSRMQYVPTAVLAGILGLQLLVLAAQGSWNDRQYLARINAELAQLEPAVKRAAALQANVRRDLLRIEQLAEFERRTREDLDLLNELTAKLPPPAWLSQLEITRDAVAMAGEAEEAAGLLKLLDDSPRLERAEFAMPISRSGIGEQFRIRATRERGKR